MPRLFRRRLAPTVWIGAVQTAWTVTLVAWILFFLRWRTSHDAGWGPLILGISLLVVLLVLAIGVVIHFSRQVAHNQATKDFVSQVSHDLRSPLATVKLHLETLKLRELDQAQREECLNAALTELARLEAGIEDVLTASRIERSALRIDLGPLELVPFLDEYASAKRKDLELHGAALLWDRDQARPLIAHADPVALRALLDNLVDNAVHHCQQGVRVRLEVVEQARCAVLAVADDGPGLEPREWKRVFRMFYRAPPSRRHTKGTGLGLFIVTGIAKAHGGRAWVESPGPNQGCVFRVAVPLAKESQA
ncbi:MAG: HAMP domain-containing histidine kinase [Deltaproteobacteria bacterium]|nr:HAMP domain-containing histidine kinase [Deltaproteobacteria bacterium]